MRSSCAERLRPGVHLARLRVQGQGGFLLLEAAIALAIIGIAAVAILSSTAGQVRAADKASVLLVERALADDRMTSLRILGYDALQDPPDSLMSGMFAAPFDEFSWVAEVAPVEEEYDLFEVGVVVSGRGETLPMSTYLHRPRPQILATDGQGGGSAGRGGGGTAVTGRNQGAGGQQGGGGGGGGGQRGAGGGARGGAAGGRGG